MPSLNLSLLDLRKAAIVAPAGCGKTQLIAESLRTYTGQVPVLVLTHTNAGVAVLRHRLTRLGVPARAYRMTTLDGWAMRLARAFPIRSGLHPDVLDLRDPKTDYPALRDAAHQLLGSGDIREILQATYAHVIVDEYQDCDVAQHGVICHLADTLPTCVLGDPMQAIFGFGRDPLPSWSGDVCATFPIAHTLDRPWRWINAGAVELGEWLLGARALLEAGRAVDLTSAPATVRWVNIGGADRYQQQLRAARTRLAVGDGSALILADRIKTHLHRDIAGQVPGAVTVENVDLRDFIAFADTVDFSSAQSLAPLIRFADSVLVNLSGPHMLQRVGVLMRGTARIPATAIEALAVAFARSPSPQRAAELLEQFTRLPGVRLVRPQLLRAAFSALSQCAQQPDLSFAPAARRVRDDLRARGRAVVGRAVGSTLLLKGLEAEISVVLDADAMDAQHLYVAMTRGARLLVLCSAGQIISPRRASSAQAAKG